MLTCLHCYKAKQERDGKEYAIEHLRKELVWPDKVGNAKEHIHLFFDAVAGNLHLIPPLDRLTNKKL